VGAGQDLGEVGEVLRLLFPDVVGGDQGKGAGGVVLWAQVRRSCLGFFEPRSHASRWMRGSWAREEVKAVSFNSAMMVGWMDGWMEDLTKSNRNC
jgi:hypothetical protein